MTPDELRTYLALPSASMREAFDMIRRVAPSKTNVYIHGPSGSGKEFVARAVHAFSPRASGPFVAVNCGAIPRDLLESELFGSEKGAYTGSVRTRTGLFEAASGGTLLLDEIGDMPLDMQVKLLRVLEERRFTRVGGSQPIAADARIVCATHRDLQELVVDGGFREDLFYRLNVFPVEICGLDERREDIPQLASIILSRLAASGFPQAPVLREDAVRALQAAPWPGNIRQLRNILERASVLYPGGTLGADEIERLLTPRRSAERRKETEVLLACVQELGLSDAAATPEQERAAGLEMIDLLRAQAGFDMKSHIAQLEIGFIRTALSESAGSVSSAARLLGLQRTTLIEKMRKHAILREDA